LLRRVLEPCEWLRWCPYAEPPCVLLPHSQCIFSPPFFDLLSPVIAEIESFNRAPWFRKLFLSSFHLSCGGAQVRTWLPVFFRMMDFLPEVFYFFFPLSFCPPHPYFRDTLMESAGVRLKLTVLNFCGPSLIVVSFPKDPFNVSPSCSPPLNRHTVTTILQGLSSLIVGAQVLLNRDKSTNKGTTFTFFALVCGLSALRDILREVPFSPSPRLFFCSLSFDLLIWQASRAVRIPRVTCVRFDPCDHYFPAPPSNWRQFPAVRFFLGLVPITLLCSFEDGA